MRDFENGLDRAELLSPSYSAEENSEEPHAEQAKPLLHQAHCDVAGSPGSALWVLHARADVVGCLAGADKADFHHRINDELPFLRKAVRRWHRDKANAEDLVQDTVLQALANAHLWQPGSNLRGWLLTIMRNRFLAMVAKSKRSTEVSATIGGHDGSLSTHASEARLLLRDVERALQRLTAIQRTVLVAVGIDGKSYSEVARILGISTGAVRCHLARARNRLRAAVDGGRYVVPFASRPTSLAPTRRALPIAPALLRDVISAPSLVGVD